MVGVDLDWEERVFGNHDIRAVLADQADELLPKRPGRQKVELEVGVSEPDGLVSAKRSRAARGFLFPQAGERLAVVLEGASASIGDDHNPRLGALGNEASDRAPGEELGVVGVRGEDEESAGHDVILAEPRLRAG
jgi:hypothetical protein